MDTSAPTGITFDVRRSDTPVPDAVRAKILEAPAFGQHFTDHMVTIRWSADRGWHDARLEPYGPLLYHGGVAHRDRQPILDRFKADPTRHVILMSYGTGSVGLNLQFTNYVFLFDRWWNPAVEDQAINRAHRLGQKETVFVTRFVSQGTIEGRIAEVLERKRQLFNELIGQNGEPSPLGLNEEEIFGLFDIKARPKRAA